MAARCATTPRERWGRAVGAVVVGGVALGMSDQLWTAVPLGVLTVFLVIGAITGWCPTDLLAPRRGQEAPRPNAFGYAQVRVAAVADAGTRRAKASSDAGTASR